MPDEPDSWERPGLPGLRLSSRRGRGLQGPRPAHNRRRCATRIAVHWFIQSLAFATLSLAGMIQGGQVGGVIAGAFGACTFLALNDWRVPAIKPVLGGLAWRLLRDPRLPAKWRR